MADEVPRDMLLYEARQMIRKVATRSWAKANKSTNIWLAEYNDWGDEPLRAGMHSCYSTCLDIAPTHDSSLALLTLVFGTEIRLPLAIRVIHLCDLKTNELTGKFEGYLFLWHHTDVEVNIAASPLFSIGPVDYADPESIPKFYEALEARLAGVGITVRFPYEGRARAKAKRKK